ncbi:MAG: RluA family pseudouridine synthase [Parcubacteria group bacterium]|jgi:23S rRNA pseudouridine1911/1915/1917 synthase
MKKIIITKNNSGERTDRFLVREFFSYTRGEIIRNIKSGNVLVNEKEVKPSHALKEGDAVEINISEKKAGIITNKDVSFEIVFENENFVVIDKPAGVQVHPSEKNEADTLVSGLLYKFPEVGTVGDEPQNRPGIVHRLDKDTSGIMLIARNQKTFQELKDKFKNHEIQKTYWAVAHGKLESKKGIIDKSLARARNYKKQTIANAKTQTKVREALTEYEVLKEGKEYSLIELKPKTGRTHQLRIHLSSLGHPIVGDEKYKLRNIKTDESVARHLLHAKKINFSLNGKNFEFEANLPDDFSKFMTEAENI